MHQPLVVSLATLALSILSHSHPGLEYKFKNDAAACYSPYFIFWLNYYHTMAGAINCSLPPTTTNMTDSLLCECVQSVSMNNMTATTLFFITSNSHIMPMHITWMLCVYARIINSICPWCWSIVSRIVSFDLIAASVFSALLFFSVYRLFDWKFTCVFLCLCLSLSFSVA